MLLCMHVTSVLFLVQFNNLALTMGVTHSYSSCPFLCALDVYIEYRCICMHSVQWETLQYVGPFFQGERVY